MYIFLAKFVYNEYIRPYFSSHVVSMIFTNDLPENSDLSGAPTYSYTNAIKFQSSSQATLRIPSPPIFASRLLFGCVSMSYIHPFI